MKRLFAWIPASILPNQWHWIKLAAFLFLDSGLRILFVFQHNTFNLKVSQDFQVKKCKLKPSTETATKASKRIENERWFYGRLFFLNKMNGLRLRALAVVLQFVPQFVSTLSRLCGVCRSPFCSVTFLKFEDDLQWRFLKDPERLQPKILAPKLQNLQALRTRFLR